MARNLTTGLQRGLRRSIAGGLGASDLFSVASLDLRFAQTKALDNRITFTRASSGTYVGSDGLIKTATTNEARFDHNPTTGESLGLLVEEQRTNLLLRSEDFSATWFTGNVAISTDTTTSPAGSNTADTATVTANATNANLYQVVACNASTNYTFSVYVKLGTLPAADFKFAVRDDSNGAFIAIDIVPSVTLSTSAWQRITYTFTTPVGCTLVRPYVYRFTSTAGGTFYVWGAQLEAGSFPTSYIPTTTATVTRSADVASITGANFSSWYNQTEGTVFAEAASYMGAAAVSRGVLSIDGAANDLHRIFRQSDLQPVAQTVTASVSQATFGFGATWNTSAPQKIAYAYATNNFGGSANGSTPQTDNSGTIPTTNTLNIGNLSTGNHFGGTIRRLTYWPSRLPNATLQQITR